MSQIKISESKSVQFPMVKHASESAGSNSRQRKPRACVVVKGEHAVP